MMGAWPPESRRKAGDSHGAGESQPMETAYLYPGPARQTSPGLDFQDFRGFPGGGRSQAMRQSEFIPAIRKVYKNGGFYGALRQ